MSRLFGVLQDASKIALRHVQDRHAKSGKSRDVFLQELVYAKIDEGNLLPILANQTRRLTGRDGGSSVLGVILSYILNHQGR